MAKKKGQTIQWPKEKGQTMRLQNTTQKTKDQATRTPQKTGMHSCDADGRAVPDPLVTPVILTWW